MLYPQFLYMIKNNSVWHKISKKKKYVALFFLPSRGILDNCWTELDLNQRKHINRSGINPRRAHCGGGVLVIHGTKKLPFVV